MIGVLAKNGATVVDKRAYAGDEALSLQAITTFQAANPSLTVEVHRDTDPDWSVAFDQVIPSVDQIPPRSSAITQLLTDPSANAKFIRAVLLVIFDEVNVIRALLPGPPAPRTVNQLKTAIQAKINSGAAD